jgi:hypothetical protein
VVLGRRHRWRARRRGGLRPGDRVVRRRWRARGQPRNALPLGLGARNPGGRADACRARERMLDVEVARRPKAVLRLDQTSRIGRDAGKMMGSPCPSELCATARDGRHRKVPRGRGGNISHNLPATCF